MPVKYMSYSTIRSIKNLIKLIIRIENSDLIPTNSFKNHQFEKI